MKTKLFNILTRIRKEESNHTLTELLINHPEMLDQYMPEIEDELSYLLNFMLCGGNYDVCTESGINVYSHTGDVIVLIGVDIVNGAAECVWNGNSYAAQIETFDNLMSVSVCGEVITIFPYDTEEVQ